MGRVVRRIKNFGSIAKERLIRYTIGLNSLANGFSNLYKILFRKRRTSTDIEWVHVPQSSPLLLTSAGEIYLVCEVLLERGVSALHNNFDENGHLVVNWRAVAFLLNSLYRSIYGERMIDIFSSQICKEKYEELQKRFPESLMEGLLEMRPEWAGELYQNHLLAYYLAGKGKGIPYLKNASYSDNEF